ncbi:MAG: hypothetical protein Q7W13_14085 [Bacteroidia bacterium]|nr:hypothetical protein [Bacteroidia bacterium]
MTKTLILPLSKKAFEITGTNEKMFELRNYSKWIESRLFDKDGIPKHYNKIQFPLGYSKDRKIKTFAFRGVYIFKYDKKYTFSNGLSFEVKAGDYIISFS